MDRKRKRRLDFEIVYDIPKKRYTYCKNKYRGVRHPLFGYFDLKGVKDWSYYI